MTETNTDTAVSASKVSEVREIRTLTANIVSAALSSGNVTVEQIPTLIREVATALRGEPTEAEKEQRPEPAVNPRKSVFNDYLICLEDGKKLKMLKRHLKTVYNLTPAEYRRRWGLPESYPMVAPSYSEKRSSLAKEIGLGVSKGGGR